MLRFIRQWWPAGLFLMIVSDVMLIWSEFSQTWLLAHPLCYTLAVLALPAMIMILVAIALSGLPRSGSA